jgi:hypothetical protein
MGCLLFPRRRSLGFELFSRIEESDIAARLLELFLQQHSVGRR